MKRLSFSFVFFGILLFLSSCGTNKRLTEQAIYFKNLNDSLLKQASAPYDPVFQKGDILGIFVSTANESGARLMNPGVAASSGSGDSEKSVRDYLIGTDGQIILPVIGAVKAEGLTKSQLTAVLTEKVRQSVATDAIVNVRLLNYKITILGEVSKPSSYTVPNERVTVLDALGLAGDLTPFGRRDNIKIIREEDGRREVGVLNLNDGNIFQSPYFYLRQNDVVYVEMNEKKMANVDQSNLRTYSLLLGAISAIGIIITTLTRL